MKLKIFYIFRVLIYTIPTIFVGWLIWKNVFSSTFEIICQPSHCSRAVKNIATLDNESKPLLLDKAWSNIGKNLSFSVDTPGNFKQAKVNLDIPDSVNVQTINMGIMQNNGEYSSHSLYFNDKYFDNTWVKKTDQSNNLILYQKENVKQYSSVENFLNNLPSLNNIAQYNFDLRKYYHLLGYIPSNKENIYNLNLIGSHEIFTYIKDEPLSLDLEYYSKSKTAENIKVSVYLDYGPSELIIEKEVNGIDGKLNLSVPNLVEGTYRIDIVASDNVVFTKLVTTQKYFCFNGHINLAERSESITIYTNGSFVKNKKGDLLKNNLIDISKIDIPNNEIFYSTAGFFFINPQNYFYPPFFDLSNRSDFFSLSDQDKLNINYVIIQKPLSEVINQENGIVRISDNVMSPELFWHNKQVDLQITSNNNLKISKINIIFSK